MKKLRSNVLWWEVVQFDSLIMQKKKSLAQEVRQKRDISELRSKG